MKHAGRPLRVFLVENDPDTRTYFALFLEHMGHTVTVAEGIADAIERLRGAEYDVLIADIGLPDGNGWELMHRMAEAGLPSPRYAIAMTGFGGSDDRARSAAAGFQRHLVKPVNGGQLEAAFNDAADALAAH